MKRKDPICSDSDWSLNQNNALSCYIEVYTMFIIIGQRACIQIE